MSQNVSGEYLQLYLKTAKESLDTLSTKLPLFMSEDLTLKKDAESECHRMAHSLKSSSHFMGYIHLSEIMLALENLFNAIKNGSVVVNVNMISTISEAVSRAKKSISSIESEQIEIDLTDQTTLLKKFST